MLDWLSVLDEPWVFSQRGALNAQQFADELGRRADTHILDIRKLEPLDRCGFLRPAYRWNPRADVYTPASNGADLLQARKHGYLRDGTEPFVPWPPRKREVDYDVHYSPWQLIDAPHIWQLIQRLTPVRERFIPPSRGGPYELPDRWAYPTRTDWVTRLLAQPRLCHLLTALEPMYLPGIRHSLSSPPAMGSFEDWDAARRAFSARGLFDRAGWTVAEVQNAAQTLLVRARGIDPLGDWHQVVSLAPHKWTELRFDALVS